MKRKTRKTIYDILARLSKLDVDTPISIEGDVYERRIRKQLETLRRSMRNARDDMTAERERNKVALASVVHDLKTPLAIIAGYSESLSDGMNDKDYAALIEKKTAEMNKQVIALVESSRHEAQQYASRRESIVFSDFFKEEVNKYAGLAKEKKISYIIKSAPYVSVYANRAELSRVIQNLISNSVKYTRYGGRIKVKAKRVDKEVRFYVKDNGDGIAKENIPYIFDKFFMEDKSRSNGSSGLGLFITKEIVDNHGGEISVKSKKKHGSTFIVRLPIEGGGKIRPTLTARFNALPHELKFIICLLFGGFLCFLYRFQRYYETRQKATLAAAILFMPLFLLGWSADLFSIMIADKITLVAD